MKLTKQIQVDINHPYYKECDDICFKSKNLYNYALFIIKKHYFDTGEHLNN